MTETPETITFMAMEASTIVTTIEDVTKRHSCPEEVRLRALTCFAKLCERFADIADSETMEKLKQLVTKYQGSASLELQLRSCEFGTLVKAAKGDVGNGINFKLGIFDCPLGYEAANAGENPNYTRSYGYSIEPTSLTGLLATYKVCDGFSLTAAIANQYGATVNTRASAVQSQKTYCAAVTLTAPDSWGFLKGAALTAGAIDGIGTTFPAAAVPALGGVPAGSNAGIKPDATLIYVGGTIPTPWETVKLGASWDHFTVSGNATTGKFADTDSFAFYASFSGIEKLKINTRVEYFDNGSGLVALGGTGKGAAAGSANAEVLAATVTLDYSLWANVITRLEYRLDHDCSHGRNLPGATAAGGYNNSQLLALNVIYKF